MRNINKIIFIGHEASLSGAPLVLLNFASWLKTNNPAVTIDILLLNKGDYLAEYRKLFNKVYISKIAANNDSLVSKIVSGLESRLNLYEDLLLKKISKIDYDVIYCNTAASTKLGVKLKSINIKSKLISHIHELNGVIRMLEPSFHQLAQHVDHFVAVSQAVVDNLIKTYHIPANKIDLIYAFVDITKNILVDQKRNELPYFKVGASGYADWRKGYDFFLLTAYFFKKRFPEIAIKYQWVGTVPNVDAIIIEEDIRKMGLEDMVEFSGKTTNPMNIFNEFDVFLLLSREDPFPLVCIEAGSLGKPIICFEKAGGINELIANGGGIAVPYQDVEEVVLAIYTYVIDNERLIRDGKVIKKAVNKYDVNILAPVLFDVLVKELNEIC